MDFYRKLLLFGFIYLLFGFSVYSSSNTFEGYISFVKETHYDTIHITFHVKDEKVRIDQHFNDGTILNSLLIDIPKEEVVAVDPVKKMYRVLNLSEETRKISANRFVIKKTGNHKMIEGKECYQWRVKDKTTNSEIAYWVTQNNLDFMNDVIQLISKTDRIYKFFSLIPGTDGFFPVLSVERTLLRKERQRIMVQSINHQDVKDHLFTIPSSYVAVKR
mgnify:CR=1 FL=1